MRVFIHTGMPKTGSSAIQDYLAEARTNLRNLGVEYPDFGHRGHWTVSALFAASGENYHHLRRRDHNDQGARLLAETRAKLDALLETREPEILLLSHEDLSVRATATGLMAYLHERLGADAEIRALAYVREPMSMYASGLQQNLKTDSNVSFLPDGWIDPHIQRATRLSALLGAAVDFRPFAPPTVADWNVIEDFRCIFAAWAGLELPAAIERAGVNTSLSAQACALLAALRSAPLSPEQTRDLRRAIRRFDEQHGGSKLRVPAEWIADVARTNAVAWNSVTKLFTCDEATRQALQLDGGSPSRRYSEADVAEWLGSNRDPAWERALAESTAASDRPLGATADRWLADRAASMAA